MNLLPCDRSAPRYFSARLIALMLSRALRTLFALSCLVAAPTLAQNVIEFGVGMPPVGRPTNIITGPDGNLWFTEQGSIGRITPAGVIKMFAVGGDIQGIAAGPDGNVWFTDSSANRIGRITAGEVVTLFGAGITGTGLWGITSGPDGNLWFTEYAGNRIGRITPAGVVTEFSAGISAGAYPFRITSGPDGNLWFTEAYGNRIGRITPAGVITEFGAGLFASANLFAITSGPDGNLWFTEFLPDRIGRITPAGVITEFSAGISVNAGPRDITSGPDGNLWFTEAWTGKIGRITPAGVITEFSAGTALNEPNDTGGRTVIGHSGITAGPDDNLWFTEAVNRIGRFTIDGFGQGAVMSLSATALTFASQTLGTTSTAQSVTLSNTDNTPLSIASIVASGDYALTHNCGTGLGVSAFCTLSITFTPSTIGTRIGTVTITGDAINSPRAIQLTGVGQGAVAFLSASALTFASQGVGSTSAAQSITLTNTGVAALNISSIVASGDFAQTNNCGATLAAGASCAVNVTFTPTVAGTRRGNLTITDDAPGTPRTISLSGAGVPAPVVTLNPGAMLFAPRSIGTTSAAKTIALSNTGGATLNLSNIQVSGDFAQSNNCGAGLGVGGSCSINVTFTPTVAGPRTGSVSITSDAPGSPHLVWLSDGALPYAVYVRSYIPAALGSSGYMGFLRVINTGKSATPVTVAVIDGTTGTVGVAGTLTTALPAGAAVTYSAIDVERALGTTIDAGSRPRIRVSALAGVQVQSLQSNPRGVVTLNAGAQSGTSVDVPSYLPWALHTSGYATYLRVINTGSNAAAVSVALIDGDSGAVGAAATLNAALPPGAAVTYSGQQIEAALGVSPAASARPRIRVTSATALDVQAFQSNPGGVVTENGYAQSAAVPSPYTVDVRNYIPAALNSAGYMGFLRVINTGSTATPVSVAVVDANTGDVGPAGTLTAALPAGAAVTYSATDIERAMGARIDAGSRPRIRVGAQTPIQIQSFQANPGGIVTQNSGAQSGTSVDVASYLPWALNTVGYATYLRIINTGSSATAVSVALIDGDTGAVGTAAMLNPALAPGTAVTYSGQQIEAALGVSLPASARPRLRVTSTTAVDVQSFQSNPGGVVTENGFVQ